MKDHIGEIITSKYHLQFHHIWYFHHLQLFPDALFFFVLPLSFSSSTVVYHCFKKLLDWPITPTGLMNNRLFTTVIVVLPTVSKNFRGRIAGCNRVCRLFWNNSASERSGPGHAGRHDGATLTWQPEASKNGVFTTRHGGLKKKKWWI